MPEDIRNTSTDAYWGDFEDKWTNLLSYRYLGRTSVTMDAGVEHDAMPLRHDMRNALGGIMAAPLCIASPESGGMDDDFYIPNPVIASMQILDPALDVTRVIVLPDIIRIGRTTGFSRATIVDAANHDRVIAISSGMGVSLGTPPPGFVRVDNPPLDITDSPSLPPLHRVFGAEQRADGSWALPVLSGDLASPDAALHLGPIHVVLETAATTLAAERAGTDRLQIEDWHVMFVARGKVGPFRTSGEVIVGPTGRIGCIMSLHDEGNDDRVITSASATYRRET